MCLALSGISASAVTQQDIDAAKQQADEIEQQLDTVNDNVENLAEQKKNIKSKMDKYTSKLEDIGEDITDTLTSIEETQAELEAQEESIEETQTQLDTQYNAMKRRIAYMYENSNESVFESILSASSFGDMLNRIVYVNALSDYDRAALDDYQGTLDELNEKKEKLEETKDDLEEKQDELNSNQEKFSRLLDASKNSLSETSKELESAENTADNLEAKLAEMRSYEAALEKQKAAEDLARLSQIKDWENEGWSDGPYDASEDEIALLAALIQCEAGGEGTVGQIAVGSVVMNRVASSRFPGSIGGVIYSAGQFSPVASGRVATVLASGANASCRSAAEAVIAGERNVSALFFRTVASAQAAGFDFSSGQIIGNHYFY